MTNENGILENDLFPVSVEGWKRRGAPTVYAGKDKLFEYINGGAEVYLSYSFIQVSKAVYVKNGTDNSVKVDIWEFGISDDAYGVFAKDKAGQGVNIGNEASLYENYLWVWKGKYFMSIEPYRGDISPDDITFIGAAVVDNIPAGEVHLPAILMYLPEEGYIQGSSRYFHKKIILDNIYISDRFIDRNVLNLSEQTDAVVADYKSETSSLPFKLLIVKYPEKSVAEESFKNFVELRESWGEDVVKTGRLHTFEDLKGKYSSISCINSFIIVTFLVETREDAEFYVNNVISKVEANQD